MNPPKVHYSKTFYKAEKRKGKRAASQTKLSQTKRYKISSFSFSFNFSHRLHRLKDFSFVLNFSYTQIPQIKPNLYSFLFILFSLSSNSSNHISQFFYTAPLLTILILRQFLIYFRDV